MHLNLITCCDKNFGIGQDSHMIWNIPEELAIFKQKTLDNIIIVGKTTALRLPTLKRRKVFYISRHIDIQNMKTDSDMQRFGSLDEALIHAKNMYPDKKVFIAGGEKIYSLVLSDKKYYDNLTIHMSILKISILECNKFIKFKDFKEWVILDKTVYDTFTHYVLRYSPGETQYLNLLDTILKTGEERLTRNAYTLSGFNYNLEFNLLRGGFPLLTSKKMFFRGIVEELLFFLRGDTDTRLLVIQGVNIWKSNTNKKFLESVGLDYNEGLMGPMYGYQLRHFNSKYDPKTGKSLSRGVDQLKNIIRLIKNDPNSRRMILTSYNPAQAREGVLYPCHTIVAQFYVSGRYLDMNCYNRSSDLLLGLPFNIASSALLLSIIAKCTNLVPRMLFLTLGDCHIYKDHISSVKTQLSEDRLPLYRFPGLDITRHLDSVEDIEKLKYSDFRLVDYKSYDSIKAVMIP